jgi:DNA-binding MarR family transcriptional regulator
LEQLDQNIFYSIDKAIRTYRQFAQTRLKANEFEMTVDQWIVMQCIQANPTMSQQEIAERVFKDSASVTRIISILVKSKFLTRKVMSSNRRRVSLKITKFGMETLDKMNEIIVQNRAQALHGISSDEIDLVKNIMNRIAENCKEK